MNHRKCLYSLLALGLTAAMASAAEPLTKPIKYGPPRAAEGMDDSYLFRGDEPAQTLNAGNIQSTQFETSDGWDLGYSVCGNEFAGLNQAGAPCCVQGSVTDVCIAKDHCGNQNCCQDDPNVVNGWYLNVLSKHCNEPHIDNVHASQTKGPGSQHMRFRNVPAGGTVVCAGPAYSGGSCRFRVHTAPDRAPGNGQSLIGRSVYTYEIAISQAIGNTRFRTLPGFHTEPVGGGGIYAFGGTGLSGMYFSPAGAVQVCRTVPCTPDDATNRAFLSYWKYDGGEYGAVTIDFDRCNNKLTLSYKNSAVAVAPSVPGQTKSLVAPFLLWTKPFGSLGGPDIYNIIDQMMIFKNNPPADPTTVDIDNYKVTHTPCPSACCNRGGLGLCSDMPSADDDGGCEAAGGRFYPNVSCAQLGKGQCLSGANLLGLCASDADCPPTTQGNPNGTCYLYYPPACTMDKGSCCNAGPGGGGACTDGVFEADCQGPVGNEDWKIWTKGATCDQDGYATACNVGLGSCSSGYAGHSAPHFCLNKPGFEPCTTDADCDVPGFCFNGICSPDSVSGHCEYTSAASAGFCQNMGRCSGSPDCDPDTGAGCCDTTCAPAVGCPAGQTCLAQPQDCDAVPGGADCAFCEGCSVWPAVRTFGCTVAADCPPLDGVPGAVASCVPNAGVACNANEDCPDDSVLGPGARTCIVQPYSPGGRVCTDDADCEVPAAPPCIEDRGACCEAVKGTCRDGTLESDCRGVQDTWFKDETCTAVEARGDCEADLGACCDEDTFGGCEQTTANQCGALKKGVFYKLQDCADITCVHKAIPTVSEWGIAVLTLLLLIGAKVYFGRRQAATA